MNIFDNFTKTWQQRAEQCYLKFICHSLDRREIIGFQSDKMANFREQIAEYKNANPYQDILDNLDSFSQEQICFILDHMPSGLDRSKVLQRRWKQ